MNENIEILQRQFDAYCTKVLKYASISYYHANRRRMEHEVSFSSLLEKDLAEVSTTDRYPCMLYRFQVREWLVEVQSEPLGHAIERLTPYRQEIILLYFFLGFKNKDRYLPVEVIIAATQGEAAAIQTVLKTYESYIRNKCIKTVYDERGLVYYGIDTDKKDFMERRLIHAVVENFRIDR